LVRAELLVLHHVLLLLLLLCCRRLHEESLLCLRLCLRLLLRRPHLLLLSSVLLSSVHLLLLVGLRLCHGCWRQTDADARRQHGVACLGVWQPCPWPRPPRLLHVVGSRPRCLLATS
jgi:hypothetical protein